MQCGEESVSVAIGAFRERCTQFVVINRADPIATFESVRTSVKNKSSVSQTCRRRARDGPIPSRVVSDFPSTAIIAASSGHINPARAAIRNRAPWGRILGSVSQARVQHIMHKSFDKYDHERCSKRISGE